MILDLAAAVAAGLLKGDAETAARAAAGPTLNPLMALGNGAASALRAAVSEFLRAGSSGQAKAARCLVPMADTTLELPAAIGNFTDFMCSIDHTRRLSPDGVPPPCFTTLPIAYHSRATTIRISGTPFLRPNGQYRAPDGTMKFGPEPSQDFELEFGAYVGPGNEMGEPIPMAAAPDHLFGCCLVNDWSARGIQFWESRPLGPFLGKSMMTTVSPWIVTAEALWPFRVPARPRDAKDVPLPYLADAADQAEGGLDIVLTADWSTEAMRRRGVPPETVTTTNFRDCYWTFAQMLTHHASNGCNLQTGDLLASGTVSGPTDGSRACIAELTKRGTAPIRIGGEERAWLHDGDEVTFRGCASRDGFVAIGFGECRGRIMPARPWPTGR
jgi:fumarylacetoacetase